MLTRIRCAALRVAIVCTFAVTLQSCAMDRSESRLSHLLAGRGGDSVIGGPRDTLSPFPLSSLLAARGTRSTVVVLDATPPFVRVFGADGTFRTAFLMKGGAPDEMLHPIALGMLGDSAVLVADITGSLSAFTVSGRLIAASRQPPFRTLSIVGACGRWFVYGPQVSDRPGHTIWLRALSPDLSIADGDFGALLVDLGAFDSPLGLGKPYGLVSSEDGVLLRHEFRSPPVLATWSCGSAVLSSLSVMREGPAPSQPRLEQGTLRLQVPARSRIPAGVADLSGGTLVADILSVPVKEGSLLTEFTFSAGADTLLVRTAGAYVIRDAVPGLGVLFETSDPIPTVFIIREADLLLALGRP